MAAKVASLPARLHHYKVTFADASRRTWLTPFQTARLVVRNQ